MKTNRVMGSILGLALGDAFGAPYEGGIVERFVWRLIGSTQGKRRWTDDTQMTIDVTESLAEHGQVNQDDLARRFAKSYRWSRGYGPGAAKTLKRIRRGTSWQKANSAVYPDGSFGNGGAMRSPAVGLFFSTREIEDIVKAARDVAEVTHRHDFAIEGAVLIAVATALAYNDKNNLEVMKTLRQCIETQEFAIKLEIAETWLNAGTIADPNTVAKELGNGISALDSCMTSIYLAFAFQNHSFEELLEFTIRLRGDVDTIAAMACSIWGAARGVEALPEERMKKLEQCDRLKELSRALAFAATRM